MLEYVTLADSTLAPVTAARPGMAARSVEKVEFPLVRYSFRVDAAAVAAMAVYTFKLNVTVTLDARRENVVISTWLVEQVPVPVELQTLPDLDATTCNMRKLVYSQCNMTHAFEGILSCAVKLPF